MMLIQKPQPALSSPISMSLSHRRQSSAPIVVQPTRIPGLLSLSKPPRSSPPRHQQRQNPKNAPKQPPASSATAPSVVRAHAQTLTLAAQIHTVPATPSPKSRGRPQEKHPKDKIMHNKRSASQSSLRGSGSGKHNNRQPSPPVLSPITTSHKKKPSLTGNPADFTNHFDPFSDQSTLTPSPTLRRHPQQSKSKAIPVPASSTKRTSTFARSDPLPILFDRRPRQQQRPGLISKGHVQEFPICDDMSEVADNDDEPTTPIARRLYQGPALQLPPMSIATLQSISSPLPSPQKNKNGDRFQRSHRRTPSDGGVFHMSSDEELSSGPGGAVLNGVLKPNLLGLFNSSPGKIQETNMTTPPRSVAGVRSVVGDGSTMNLSTSAEKAAFFASSLFQNSPSPDELPDPLLL